MRNYRRRPKCEYGREKVARDKSIAAWRGTRLQVENLGPEENVLKRVKEGREEKW